MLWTVFKFEVAYWFKRPLTLLFAALFFLMAFFATASDAFLGIATGQIHRNAPFVMMVLCPTRIVEWGHGWLDLEPERAGGPSVRSGGTYLTVWDREADGHWRITRNLAF